MIRRPLGLAAMLAVVTVGGCSAETAVPVKSPLAGVLFINELMASNKSTVPDEHGDYADWVELYNGSDAPVNLRSFYLTDDLTKPMKWAFPDTAIPARGYLVLWADAEYRQGALHTSFRLDAETGEQLGLYSTDGDRVFLVDTLSFGPQFSDTSWGRLPDGDDNWQFLAVPTPGAANSSGLSGLHGRLFINEFMASNRSTIADENGDYDDWVELYNATDSVLRLSAMRLTDDLARPAKWTVPDTVIPARGFLLIWADGEESEGPLHASFNLGAAQGEELGLFEAFGIHSLLVDSVRFGPQSTDTSYGRLPDGDDDWQSMPRPSPRAANRAKR